MVLRALSKLATANQSLSAFPHTVRRYSVFSIIRFLEEGTCLFWEFATDHYDIGFGVYFEWTTAQTNQVVASR